MHRKALFTFDGNSPGERPTTVLAAGLSGILVFQCTDNNVKGLKAFSHFTIRLSCLPTDRSDYFGGGSDEGVGLLTLIAVGLADSSTSYLRLTPGSTHLPVYMLIYKFAVTRRDTCILTVHTGKQQQQTSQLDPHDSVKKRQGKAGISYTMATQCALHKTNIQQ